MDSTRSTPAAGWPLLALHPGLMLAALAIYPMLANDFFILQIGGQTLMLGLIALSLMLLAGYGGMVTLSQMTVAGISAYMVALLGDSHGGASLGWPWWLAIPAAIMVAVIAAAFIGALSAKTEGIYTIMITLAVGVAVFYLVLQNRVIFNGFQGLSHVRPPVVLGVDWRTPVAFYYLALACAVAGYYFVWRLRRTAFGLALQGIRDNPRRMSALGYDVIRHRIAAHAMAGAIAGVGGVLLAWYNTFVSPATVGVDAMINVLLVAVIGGIRHPLGAFLGAAVFVLLQSFAIDLIGSQRFRLLIGLIFLSTVLFSQDGLLGLWAQCRRWWVSVAGRRPFLISSSELPDR
ncbi:branched-chain amino acid ABC transporter permease [Vineibacter terrae]|uniref:Branched-chain amino acid ABC transporter permease n=1 Tax=Vineibacter terrae TaxID=2586908 RepID=A0A5C8PA16_9HYPH|nr:branched-chain amino acid ABC transporter permease [Vineibacter terrae]TXL70067.1 branched-chain amino acid ABC transporter permease [Vineibacter terrae]